jgi:hypothetical protein
MSAPRPSQELNVFPDLTVASVQMGPRIGRKAENVARSIQLIEQAAASRAVIMNEDLASGLGIRSGAYPLHHVQLGCRTRCAGRHAHMPLSSLDPGMGLPWLVSAFMLVMVSGHSILSLLLTCLVFGACQVLVSTYANPVLGGLAIAVLAALTLRVRPKGFSPGSHLRSCFAAPAGDGAVVLARWSFLNLSFDRFLRKPCRLGNQEGHLLLQPRDDRPQKPARSHRREQMHLIARQGFAQTQRHDLAGRRTVQQCRVREHAQQVTVDHQVQQARVVGARCGHARRSHPADGKGFLQHIHGSTHAGSDDGPRRCLQVRQ